MFLITLCTINKKIKIITIYGEKPEKRQKILAGK